LLVSNTRSQRRAAPHLVISLPSCGVLDLHRHVAAALFQKDLFCLLFVRRPEMQS
jgi:hypothetical protein